MKSRAPTVRQTRDEIENKNTNRDSSSPLRSFSSLEKRRRHEVIRRIYDKRP